MPRPWLEPAGAVWCCFGSIWVEETSEYFKKGIYETSGKKTWWRKNGSA